MLLAAETIKREVFPGLTLNAIVDVNFKGFIQVVDALGCAYVNVDHRYIQPRHGLAETNYTSDQPPARLPEALLRKRADYVRYRHTDSDFVRVARQQDFLRNLREQVSRRRRARADRHGRQGGRPCDREHRARLGQRTAQAREADRVLAVEAAAPGEIPDDQRQRVQIAGGSYVTSSSSQLERETLDRFLNGHEQLARAGGARDPLGTPTARTRAARAGASGLVAHVPGDEGEAVKASVSIPFRVLYPALQTAPSQQQEARAYEPRRPGRPPAPRLCGRLAAEHDRRLLRLRGHRLAQPAAVRALALAADQRPPLPDRRRRLAHPRRRLAPAAACSTGSRTRCWRNSRTTQMLAIARSARSLH